MHSLALPPDVLSALRAIDAGAKPDDVESETLDFKEPVARSRDDTAQLLRDASVCFANASGGVTVLGVDDDVAGLAAFVGTDMDTEWLRHRIHELTRPSLLVQTYPWNHNGVRLVVVEAPVGIDIYSDPQGRATRRVSTACEILHPSAIASLQEERRGIDWSASPSGRQVEDVHAGAVEMARRRLARFLDTRREMARLQLSDLMRDLGLATPDGELLRAGEVLFCSPEGVPLHYQYRNTPGGEVANEYRDAEPTLSAFEAVMERVASRGNAIPIMLKGGQQIEVRDFPELAVREALVNGIVHRDYRLEGPVSVEHSPQLFSIHSPGALVSGVTTENILTHASKPRNPLLAHAAHQLGLAERSGRGVDRIYREMIRAGKQPPFYEVSIYDTRVSLTGGAPNKRIATYVANLPDEEQEDVDAMLVLFTLTQTKRVDAPRLAPILQRPIDATEMILRRLASDEVEMIAPSTRTARNANPNYYLRPEALRVLGPALVYRAEGHDVTEEKIIRLVEANGTVDNANVQISCDVDVQTASNKLRDMSQREILEKLGTQARGPGIKYGPGSKFPGKKPRPRRAS